MLLAETFVLLSGVLSVLGVVADARGGHGGTFKNPAARSRPRFRYWLPDASVDADTVSRDIQAAGRLGAGGAEFVPFYNYGGKQGAAPKGSDWARYGFGTEPWTDMFKTALRAHADAGMYMDFPLGPNQGQGVPAAYGDEGLQWNLLSFTSAVSANGSFDGVIPGWGSGQLVAVTSATALSEQTRFRAVSDFSGTRNLTWIEYRLAHNSLEDHTDRVSAATGTVKLDFTTPVSEPAKRRIFAFYQMQPHYRSLSFDNIRPTGTIFDNGSLVVDHHSARGAKTLTDFWEKHVLDDEVLGLIQQAGNYVWEDSVEIVSNMTWTPSLPATFKRLHGYDIKRVLPLLIFNQTSIYAQRQTYGEFNCLLDTPYEGLGYLHDYRRALEAGYNEYISAVQNWVRKRLGLLYSCQPTYGLPQDMSAAIPHVDIPEYESLAFSDKVDNYRRFIGTAHLAGKNIISNELGALVMTAYRQTLSAIIDSVHTAIVGGTNQLILHGQTYSGSWYGTTWPGYTPFQYLFSELHSPKQPAWENGMSEVINYFARLQHVQRQGIPRTDVAVITKESRTTHDSPPLYPSKDLEDNGWSYSYISPVSFSLPQAYVKNGLLGPEGPAWKALVVQQSDNLTAHDVTAIQRFADEGLPVILSGGTPAYWATRSSCDKKDFERLVNDLTTSANVHLVEKGQVAAKLSSLGLTPRARLNVHGKVYVTWREDAVNNVNYAFILNHENATVSGTAIFQTAGKPALLDAWTGEETAVLDYQDDGDLKVPIELAPRQAVVLAIYQKGVKSVDDGHCHFTSLSPDVLGVVRQGKFLAAHVPAGPSAQGQLAKGRKVSLSPGDVSESWVLSNWTLTAEKWERPSDMNDMVTIAAKTNATLALDRLRPWLEIEGLNNSSGVGYYSTSFDWSSSKTTGAYLSMGSLIHTAKVLVNGQTVAPFDHHNAIRDITRHMVDGTNNVLIIVPTTMWNYLSTISQDIKESGGIPTGWTMAQRAPALFPPQAMGLIGEVSVVPYKKVVVACSGQ